MESRLPLMDGLLGRGCLLAGTKTCRSSILQERSSKSAYMPQPQLHTAGKCLVNIPITTTWQSQTPTLSCQHTGLSFPAHTRLTRETRNMQAVPFQLRGDKASGDRSCGPHVTDFSSVTQGSCPSPCSCAREMSLSGSAGGNWCHSRGWASHIQN